jgi:hypothetical protein
VVEARGLIAVIASVGCGHSAREPERGAQAYPVGIAVCATAAPQGAPGCTFHAPATVADQTDRECTKLIGEGELILHCPDRDVAYDVLRATAIEIHGPTRIHVGANQRYDFRLLAGQRAIEAIPDTVHPNWVLTRECEGRAMFDFPTGVLDTHGIQHHIRLIGVAPGSCLMRLDLLGVKTEMPVTIE